MKKIIIISVCAVAAFSAQLHATVINIPADYQSIQIGIIFSHYGDTIIVHPGTYVENIDFMGHEIIIGSLYFMTGDTSYISSTIIDGNGSGAVVRVASGEGWRSKITGFTITNGSSQKGGGIFCDNESYTQITNNIIRGNYGGRGGGIYCEDSYPIISANLIIENQASDGAGIFCYRSYLTIINNEISNNIGNNGSGICYLMGTGGSIINNTIADNIGYTVGGIYLSGDSRPSIVNCILWNNSSPEISGLPTVSYSDIRGGWEGEGNLDIDPLFVDPLSGDYNICSSSPCLDTGHPDIYDPDSTRSDIGRFYWEHPDCDFRTILYVSPDGNDSSGDGSPGSPYRTIQHAIEISHDYDTVLVDNGRYVENIEVYFKRILIGSNFIFSADTLDILNTIIDGDSTFAATRFVNCDSLTIMSGFAIERGLRFGVLCQSASPKINYNIITNNYEYGIYCEDSEPTIDRCRIVNSLSDAIYCERSNPLITKSAIIGNSGFAIYNYISSPYISGDTIMENLNGGIYCHYSDPSISNTVISSNFGSAIYCFEADPVINNNIIAGNSGTSGAGISCISNSRPTISGNNINDNYSSDMAGGIYCLNSDPTINGNTIEDNLSENGGGAISCINSDPAITANTISNNRSSYGGGIYCSSSNPIIADNTIQSNIALFEYPDGGGVGGGIYCISNSDAGIINNNISFNIGGGVFCAEGSDLLIESNIISGNAADDGGGILSSGSNPLINLNIIENNSATWVGGGIYLGNCAGIISNNTVRQNIAQSDGGGIYCIEGSPRISNTSIIENSTLEKGGGIFLLRSNPLIENNVFSLNNAISTPDGQGGGIYSRDSAPTINNTILWADTAQSGNEIFMHSGSSNIAYSDISGGWQGTGNVNVDPLFRNPESGDFHLMSIGCGDPYDSPCIDIGDPSIIDSLLDCSWGLGYLRSDMGAFAGRGVFVDINDPEEPAIPSNLVVFQNFPNPFNPSTTIRYSLPEQTDVRIEIYNILGQCVATVFNGNKQAGYHTITWQADDYPSGVYFARLDTDDRSESIKMVLLK